MEIVKQLAVFLENKPGTLARMCRALQDSKINIIALTISDTIDHSVVRMVVSNPHKALLLLEERNVLVVENDVIIMDNTNRPGSLGHVAEVLARAKVNIEYAYLATPPNAKKGILVFRPTDCNRALKALQKAAL